MSAQRAPGPLTPAMLRELRSINRWGEPADISEYGARHLAFWSREKVLSALIHRGLIEDAVTITAAGRAAIAKATGATS